MVRRLFGYIEGYYGRMLSWEERGLIVDALHEFSLNGYIYAPKEDPYHRLMWRAPYPRQWMSGFSLFVEKAADTKVAVIPGIAPGLSFDYQSRDDYKLLLRKFAQLARSGVPAIGLLMDDIPVRLPPSCRHAFGSLGEAHARLVGRLLNDVKKAHPGVGLLFCPTVYADQFLKDDPAAAKYLADLAAGMPRSVPVFWTGPAVISREMDARSLRRVNDLFGNNVCIWDNLYANDYCPRRLFFGGFRNRSTDLLGVARGILLNPTGLVRTDSFLLSLLSGFVKKISPEKAWKAAAKKFSLPPEVRTIAPFFNLPQAAIPKNALTSRNLAAVRRALKKLIWEWKSPLQREWYPFLYSLDCDIALLQNDVKGGRGEWIRKKYPPVLARMLVKSK
jgi:hyaluronoglucosaminidase